VEGLCSNVASWVEKCVFFNLGAHNKKLMELKRTRVFVRKEETGLIGSPFRFGRITYCYLLKDDYFSSISTFFLHIY